MVIEGKIWKFGDNIDTDKIIPARYLNTSDPKELAEHCMEDEDTSFAKKVQKGDIIVAGKNFGSGSSREHAPIAIKECGVTLVIAESFARIFFRSAINIALPVIEDRDIANEAENGDIIKADLDKGIVINVTKGKEYKTHALPDMMKMIFEKNGLMNYAKELIGLK